MTRAHVSPLRIGPVSIGLPVVQAALSGYSDLAMRRVARAHGAPYCLNEVVLNATLLTRGKLQRRVLELPVDDHPVGGQLMGAEPEEFGRAARLLVEAGYDVVDLNFGCPVPKALGRHRGGYLLSDPSTALAIVDRVLDAVSGDVPVTVKMRRGLDDSIESERSFFTILDGVFVRGATGVTVHPRTVMQRYVGPAEQPFLSRVRRHLGSEVLLLGSGDLFGPHDVLRMLMETGVNGVTLARGCIGNPWLFGQVADLLAGREPGAPSVGAQRRALEMHLGEAVACHGPEDGPGRTRHHAIQYAAVHPESVLVRDAFVAARGESGIRAVLERYYPGERADEVSGELGESGLRAQALKSCGVAGSREGRSPDSRRS